MDVFKTPGAISWSELTTTDPAAAAAFYGQLFGWTFKEMGAETGHYCVAHVGDTAIGGVMGMPPDAPAGMPPHWGNYVTVDNVDQTLAKATALGGKVLVPAMDIPTVGRMAVLQDPQGAVISLMAYSPG